MICFVVLHYLATEETILCVESIRNNVIGKKQIIVVDNASPNNSFEVLSERYKSESDIVVIKTEKNLGFANGNNFGYNYAIGHYDPEFIVVMNNDMEIKQSDFLNEIYKSFEEYQYYILGPDIFSTKKNYHQNPQTRKLPTRKDLSAACRKLWLKEKFRFLLRLKWWIKGKSHKKENLTVRNDSCVNEVVINPLLHGSCYVFSKLFIGAHKNACFYDKTFMYMEAEILYYLARKNNELMIYYPNLKVDHHEDVATDESCKNRYKKSLFSIKCLHQSSKVFLELMRSEEKDVN